MENVINTLHLSGKVVGTPVVGHEAFGEKFYYLTLGVPRLSGAQDLLPVTLSERLLDGTMLADGDALTIDGQVRSYNKIIEGAGRLLITAFAQKIVENDEHENPNQIQLTGTLCKAPAYARRRSAANCRYDAGCQPRLRKERLHPVHHVGAQRALCRQAQCRRQDYVDWPPSIARVSETDAGWQRN